MGSSLCCLGGASKSRQDQDGPLVAGSSPDPFCEHMIRGDLKNGTEIAIKKLASGSN
jgi:hypothetical protein